MHNWLNLSNGLLAIKNYHLTNFHVMRLQSTHCEQKLWKLVLWSIPDEFLFQQAQSQICFVHDYGERTPVPRAVWQGLEWVKFVLAQRWNNTHYVPVGRASTMGPYFSDQYRLIDNSIKRKIDYHKQFLKQWDPNQIVSVTKSKGEIDELDRLSADRGIASIPRSADR